MIEQGIYFALGCIVTALAAMMFAPVFWRRALRLTRKRLQLQIPLSMQEIFAERDQLRAEFAVERLQIEQDLERVQAGKARDMAEIGRRSMEVSRFADKLSALRVVEQNHETEIDRLSREIAERDSEIGTLKAERLAEAETLERLRRDTAAAMREAADSRAKSVELQAAQAKATADNDGLKMELQDARDLVGRLQSEAITNSLDVSHQQSSSSNLTSAQAKVVSLEQELASAQSALVDAREREKSFHLESSLKAEKGRSADRSATARLEVLQTENASLQSALDLAQRNPAPVVATTDNDGGLRESIHALGLAVAAMTRDTRRSTSSETSKDKVQPVA